MESTRIRQRIRYYTDLLDEVRANERTTEQYLSEVRTLAEKRNGLYTQMDNDLAMRRTKLNGSSIDVSRVKMMKNLSQGLDGLLNQGNVHLTRIADQKYQVARAESELEDRLRQYQINERNYVNTIADLKRQLTNAETQEAAQNA